MKYAVLAAALLLAIPHLGCAQGVGVGTTSPDPSAALEVQSSSQGFLPPRLNTTQRDAIAAPAVGLTLFNTSTGVPNTWDGGQWTAPLLNQAPVPAPLTFAYTGGPQTYTVPAGVFSLGVDLAGGGGSGGSGGGSLGGLAGRGGRVQATLAVQPGQVLTLYVGGAGSGGAGGYNGGGSSSSFGGGGGTDLRRGGAALPDRLLVAGGGGGGGYFGGGGGDGGQTGSNGQGSSGGRGGTATTGGAAGGTGATGGTAGQGGSSGLSFGIGGGGGGGYFGGGGGGSGNGGGGGSGFAGAGTSGVVFTTGYQRGNGSATLTPLGPTPAAPVLDGTNFTNLPWTRTGTSLYPTVLGNFVGIGTSTPTSTLAVAGSEAGAYLTTGPATNFPLTDAHRTVRRLSACTTLTLPDAATCPGRLYTLINPGGQGACTLAVAGGGPVTDDITGTTFTGPNAFAAATRLTVQSTGSAWVVVGR